MSTFWPGATICAFDRPHPGQIQSLSFSKNPPLVLIFSEPMRSAISAWRHCAPPCGNVLLWGRLPRGQGASKVRAAMLSPEGGRRRGREVASQCPAATYLRAFYPDCPLAERAKLSTAVWIAGRDRTLPSFLPPHLGTSSVDKCLPSRARDDCAGHTSGGIHRHTPGGKHETRGGSKNQTHQRFAGILASTHERPVSDGAARCP